MSSSWRNCVRMLLSIHCCQSESLSGSNTNPTRSLSRVSRSSEISSQTLSAASCLLPPQIAAIATDSSSELLAPTMTASGARGSRTPWRMPRKFSISTLVFTSAPLSKRTYRQQFKVERCWHHSAGLLTRSPPKLAPTRKHSTSPLQASAANLPRSKLDRRSRPTAPERSPSREPRRSRSKQIEPRGRET